MSGTSGALCVGQHVLGPGRPANRSRKGETSSSYPDSLLTGMQPQGTDGSSDCGDDAERPIDTEWGAVSGERVWWLLHTKSRQEKALARQLHSREIPYYLPLVKQSSPRARRSLPSYVTLFPGYLFLFGTREERLAAFDSRRVASAVEVVDQSRLVRDLTQIERLIAQGVPLTLEQRLRKGDQVRVRTGVLRGLEGVVYRRQGKTRLLIFVDYLQQGAAMEVKDFEVEKI